MANIRLIKGRIKSAKNIAQITKAMELVAAAKMRKAQAAALSGKLYAQKIFDMVTDLSGKTSSEHPYLHKPKELTGKKLVIFVSTNKGLCGGLNTSLFRFFLDQYQGGKNVSAVTLGKKGASFLAHTPAELTADFSNVTSFVNVAPAVIELVTAEFVAGHYDSVDIVFNEFINVVKQEPKRKTVLPLTVDSVEMKEKSRSSKEVRIEPSIDEVFASLLPHYLENQVRDAVLQAEASEHSARMVAMRNATDNALSLMDDLTLIYNKARQEKITYEITDLITATMALAV